MALKSMKWNSDEGSGKEMRIGGGGRYGGGGMGGVRVGGKGGGN